MRGIPEFRCVRQQPHSCLHRFCVLIADIDTQNNGNSSAPHSINTIATGTIFKIVPRGRTRLVVSQKFLQKFSFLTPHWLILANQKTQKFKPITFFFFFQMHQSEVVFSLERMLDEIKTFDWCICKEPSLLTISLVLICVGFM